jgi:hypothetical protein
MVAHARAEEVPTHRLLWDGVAFVGMRPELSIRALAV